MIYQQNMLFLLLFFMGIIFFEVWYALFEVWYVFQVSLVSYRMDDPRSGLILIDIWIENKSWLKLVKVN